MRFNDRTRMGGKSGDFVPTPWTEIGRLKSAEPANANDLIGYLLEKYWKPVYRYLRYKGYDNEQAKDLTQGFFHEVVLGRGLIQQADKAKGRFRTFLLFALERYLKSEHRKRIAKKRIPQQNLINLERIDPAELAQPFDRLSNADYFNYTWVSAMLDKILTEVETNCRTDGMKVHWQVFSERVVQPVMEGTEPPSMAQVCDKFDIENSTKASNMIASVKRCFQTALRRYLRESVSSDAQINEELRELMQFFEKTAQDNK